jgi:hypothetical protein
LIIWTISLMVLPIFNFGVNFFSINLIRASNFINNIFILIIWTISLMVLWIFNFGVNFFSQYNTTILILVFDAGRYVVAWLGSRGWGGRCRTRLEWRGDDSEDEKWYIYYYPFNRPTERDQTLKWIVCISNTSIQYLYLSVAYLYQDIQSWIFEIWIWWLSIFDTSWHYLYLNSILEKITIYIYIHIMHSYPIRMMTWSEKCWGGIYMTEMTVRLRKTRLGRWQRPNQCGWWWARSGDMYYDEDGVRIEDLGVREEGS